MKGQVRRAWSLWQSLVTDHFEPTNMLPSTDFKRRITPISESDASARMLEKSLRFSTVMTVMCLVSLCYPSSSYLLFSMHVSLVSLACTVRSQPTAGSSFSSRSLKKIWRPCATRIQKKLIASWNELLVKWQVIRNVKWFEVFRSDVFINKNNATCSSIQEVLESAIHL